MLYPLKFETVYKEKIWGGNRIKHVLNKDFSPLKNCGETWEISAIEPDCSVVKNGFLAGNSLNELIEIYMGDLVGEKIFDSFGTEFPLLIKFIDAQSDLSVQIHPDNETAQKLHRGNGKTEMWYIVDAQPDAKLNIGFNQTMNKTLLKKHLDNNTLEEVLNFISVQAGDAVFIPAGKVHAIGKGILLAEIQQSSDVTYRLYDYNRKDENGNFRQLHIDKALDAIHYDDVANNVLAYPREKNRTCNIVRSPYFTTNYMDFDKAVEKIYANMDTFVIYICVDGKARIVYERGEETIALGECILIPAAIDQVNIIPENNCKLLEVYIP
jgi:mannose-6-phosphate isomerase